MAKQVVIILHVDGRIEADMQGFSGQECEKDAVLQAIQAMLAPGTVQEHRKPEYYQHTQARVQQKG